MADKVVTVKFKRGEKVNGVRRMQGEVAQLPEALAQQLIAAGIARRLSKERLQNTATDIDVPRGARLLMKLPEGQD